MVREATERGFAIAEVGDSINIGFPESKTRRGRVGHQVAQTLLTGDEQVVVVEDRCIQMGMLRDDIPFIGNYERSRRFYDPKGISPALTTKNGGGQEVKIGEEVSGEVDLCVETTIRVRRLTPREYYRLMGFTDEDYDKASAVCSETQLYKQGGNSIVVNVLEGIFNNLKPYFAEET